MDERICALVRRYGHFDVSEDAVQEALVAAAVQWPDQGVPENPRAWLITVASRRLVDGQAAARSLQRRRSADDLVTLGVRARWPAGAVASRQSQHLRDVERTPARSSLLDLAAA
jgi:predicted RNA polymerase sigma factor